MPTVHWGGEGREGSTIQLEPEVYDVLQNRQQFFTLELVYNNTYFKLRNLKVIMTLKNAL